MDSKQDNRFICGLLWDPLSIHPHGHISPCCEVDWEYPGEFARNKNAEGKYTETVVNIAEGIDKARNSDTFKEIRKKMLSGDVPDACKTCHKWIWSYWTQYFAQCIGKWAHRCRNYCN